MTIAIAVMAKAPCPGETKTRLAPPLTPSQAAELYKCFLRDRFEQLMELQTDLFAAYFPVDAREAMRGLAPGRYRLLLQEGVDLGERLFKVLTELLRLGYAGAIAIDSDSPTLPTRFVRDAVHALERRTADLVLGPCEDGGYYLIGCKTVKKEIFQNIAWSTKTVFSSTVEAARRAGFKTMILDKWYDVDSGDDLNALLKDLTSAKHDFFTPRNTKNFLQTNIKNVSAKR